jgi:hypothetical protein
MKLRILHVTILLTCSLFGIAQRNAPEPDSLTLLLKAGIYTPLSYYDSVYLSGLPTLELPESYRGPNAPLLPAVLDNSDQPYMRPVFNQAGYSCGQASLVGYNFTYEINYTRGTPANVTSNQHPTHFTWNWMNAGNYYGGVSYYHSMEVLRNVGDPSVADYGGMSYGGEKRWMSGYNLYYNAMHNRIRDVYNIRTDSYDGFMALKYWLYDHLENASVGGVASFYANQPYTQLLPPGTPEAGKYVCTAWSSSASHALCIVGYNDSIRWDYNNDGQYTNNLDISGDGLVTMKDWEIGGFKFVNSYGGVPNWADSGYCYMMYKTVADVFGQGGIWNNTVNVLKPKTDCAPQLTMKATITYTCRNQLNVTAGVSTDLNATAPAFVIGFPIFNYQGGCLYMQGGNTEADKTIEFGLDVTPLLNYLQPGQPAKFFLQVQENDPNNWSTGQINSLSLIDYTSGMTEIPCAQTNVNIQQNAITNLSVVATINYSDVSIQNSSLPLANLYEPYSYQLSAAGGTTPYEWDLRVDFQETAASSAFPTVNSEQLIPTSNINGYAIKVLPFEFPFYGERFDTVYMYVNGFLKFDKYLVTWPYHQDKYFRFLKNRNVAAFFDMLLRLYPDYGDGLWCSGDETGATFRWTVSQDGAPSSSDINLAVKLFPSGKIEFYYGTVSLNYTTSWYAGATKGDAKNYQISSVSNANPPPQNYKVEFQPNPFPVDMAMENDGTFHGTPLSEYDQFPVKFIAIDQNNISSTRILPFTTTGIKSTFEVSAGGDEIIEAGDTVIMDVTLKNIAPTAYTGAMMQLACTDGMVDLVDSVQSIGSIQPGQTLQFDNSFIFVVDETTEDGHTLAMQHTIISVQDTLQRSLTFTATAPNLVPGLLSVDDGQNGILDAGETTDLVYSFKNSGGGKATNLIAEFASTDPYITVNQGSDTLELAGPHSTSEFVFNITVSASTPYRHIAYFTIEIQCDQGVTLNDSLFLVVGEIIENFETGDFTSFPWEFAGHQPWSITESQVFEGDYSARSGVINDSQISSLILEADVLSNSEIAFYSKVSSEVNYDFLFFYVDGVEQSRWSGEVGWDKHVYDIVEGFHTFKWTYQKDANVVSGSDCAWVDYIILPPIESYLITVYAGADDTICQGNTCQLEGNVDYTTSAMWETSGSGTFDDATLPNAVYTPSTYDVNVGKVTLTLTGTKGEDLMLSDSMDLKIVKQPFPNAGFDQVTCMSEPVAVHGEITYSDSLEWVTSGDGTFSDPNQQNTFYWPGEEDVENGSVFIILIAFPRTPCLESVSDTSILTIQHLPAAFAGDDGSACMNAPYTLSGVTENSSSVLWGTLGDGVFDDPSLIAATYDPGEDDLEAGFADLILTAFSISPCEGSDSDTVRITFIEAPEADAGEDQVIQYNTATVLNGNATGGSGGYLYHWEPATYLVDPDVQDPVTVPLTNTISFILTATDQSGCTGTDEMTIAIEGSPFTILVTANPGAVCEGDTTFLNAEIEGDTGPYTFTWSSDPPGFSSDIQDPFDVPSVSTTYYVDVTDSQDNLIQGFVTVEVTKAPTAYAGEDTLVCPGGPVLLNGMATDYVTVRWITYGDGFFDDTTILEPLYYPGEEDILFGNALLRLLVTGNDPCQVPASDMVLIGFYPAPEVTLYELPDLCLDDPPYQLIEGSPPGGIYSGTGVEDGYFFPSLAGVGAHLITYTITDGQGCSASAEQVLHVFDCTALEDLPAPAWIKVIPNPNDGNFDILIRVADNSKGTIRLYNSTGKQVYVSNVSLSAGINRIPLTIGYPGTGMYLLRLENKGTFILEKILVR